MGRERLLDFAEIIGEFDVEEGFKAADIDLYGTAFRCGSEKVYRQFAIGGGGGATPFLGLSASRKEFRVIVVGTLSCVPYFHGRIGLILDFHILDMRVENVKGE